MVDKEEMDEKEEETQRERRESHNTEAGRLEVGLNHLIERREAVIDDHGQKKS